MAKKKTTKKAESDPEHDLPALSAKDRLAQAKREEKAAKLRRLAAQIEAGEDVDEDEDDDFVPPSRRPSAPMSLPSLLGGIADLVAGVAGHEVEQETPKNAEGGPGFRFARPGGRVKNVRLDANGNFAGAEFDPGEWPPRGEQF